MQRQDLRTVGLAMLSLRRASSTKAPEGGRSPGAPAAFLSAEKMMKSIFRLVVVSAISGPWAYPALAQFGSLAIDSCETMSPGPRAKFR